LLRPRGNDIETGEAQAVTGMNSVDEEQREEEPAPSCALRFQRVLKDYIAEQRELIDKFRRKLN
jgi:hypothetical protein